MYYAGIEKKKNPKGKAVKTKKAEKWRQALSGVARAQTVVRRPVGMGNRERK